jgi:hypothetical protein
MSDDAAFDGGRTAHWLASGMKEYLAVTDVNTGHTIHVVTDNRITDLMADLLLALRLMNWMSSKPVIFYWWDQPWVRELPANVAPSRDHVNGGWAIPGSREVHVYRREEVHKVLLHEMIHALGMDIPSALTDPVRGLFEEQLGRRLWPHFFEAHTELYAEFLWSIARSTSIKDAERFWKGQERCSAKQAILVWTRTHNLTDPEETNIFSYYIQKWVLMQHLAEVLLDPSGSVAHWFSWWLAAAPQLTSVEESKSVTLRLGMTCPR